MNLINTYYLATNGQNSVETYTLASNGILYGITIEDLPQRGGGPSEIGTEYSDKKVKRKKITVTALVNGVEYTESLIVENKPSLTVGDVLVEINKTLNKSKVKISIQIL
tara:strand:- start:128 stop:454 length:327 start_codon:yes stop_codon:yes gene_type:complete